MGGAPANLYECGAFIPLMVCAWCMHGPFSMLYLLTQLLNSCRHTSPIPHALPITSHALAVRSHAPHCCASPITSHMPCLSTHGVEPSICGPLPYPLSSLEPPCPACRRAPAHPLQCCCCQHPATRVTLIHPTSSPAHTLACLLGPAAGGHTQVTHRAPRR